MRMTRDGDDAMAIDTVLQPLQGKNSLSCWLFLCLILNLDGQRNHLL